MKRLALLLASTALTSLAHADSIPVFNPAGDVINLPTDRSKLIIGGNLAVCVPGSPNAPVPAGQAFLCSGMLLIAK